MSIQQIWQNGLLISLKIDGVQQEVTDEIRAKYPRPNRAKTAGADSIGLMRKAVNLSGAAKRVAAALASRNQIRINSVEQEHRLAICKACEFFTGITCLKCGCVARFKTKLATEKCPIGKW